MPPPDQLRTQCCGHLQRAAHVVASVGACKTLRLASVVSVGTRTASAAAILAPKIG